MGNFEKLSVLVIVVIIVMILVVALHTWSEKPGEEDSAKPPAIAAYTDPAADQWEPPAVGENPVDEPVDSRLNESAPIVEGGDALDTDFVIEPSETDTEASSPAMPVASTPTEYVVQPGDTIGHISQRLWGTVKYASRILEVNPGVDPSALKVGSTLILPAIEGAPRVSSTRDGAEGAESQPGPAGPARPGGTYTTRAGDSFERIAKRVYGTIERWPDIWVKNLAKVPDADRIPPGTVLQLP